MGNLELIYPDKKYRKSYAAALREGLNIQPAREEDILLAEKDLDAYMTKRHDLNTPVTLPNGQKCPRVPQTDLWLVDGQKFLGCLSIRHELNDYLMERGGHIGYAVRASERRKGYGKLMLKMALPYAKLLGLEKILITCHDQNIGSIKIIEGNGGVYQDKVEIEGLAIPERRYWITL